MMIRAIGRWRLLAAYASLVLIGTIALSCVGPPPLAPSTPELLQPADSLSYVPTAQLPCGLFDLGVFELPPGAEDLPGPEFDALRESASEQGYTRETWRIADRTPTRATFVSQLTNGWACIETTLINGIWDARQEAESTTLPITLAPGLGPATWALDADPLPDATRLAIRVTEYNCAGGIDATGRIAPPLVEIDDESITIAFGIRPLTAEANTTCPGNPATHILLELPQQVAGRTFLDGGVYPPAAVPRP